ncbi:MAG: ArsA-related P-loop ATPase [Pseudomonadota bacterium]
MSRQLDPDRFLGAQRIVICCGSGGVGKTTTAAALGLRAAELGRDVLVMTIDPARRLAQALGLDGLSHEPQAIDTDTPGRLAAMMLDPKSAFDQLVHRHAPSAEARDAILANRYYQQLAESFGGSRELISMEQVLAQAKADPERLLIVDTPPAEHALDFLDAPRRVLGLLDGSLTEAFLKPYQSIARVQFNLFRQSSAMTLKFIEGLTGSSVVSELGEFLNSFSVLFDGFRDRAREVRALMQESQTGFLLICAPDPLSLREVNRFAARLSEENLAPLGVLVNRLGPGSINGTESGAAPALDLLQDAGASPALLEAAAEVIDDTARRRTLELESLRSYLDPEASSDMRALPNLCIPEFEESLSSLPDLSRYAAAWRTAISF